ncbi:thioesterase II family protein [Actinokineospora sp.]|uniref:thioesterase II family protein n=1 Tax=Actinokineospora sp. TaxID=1872133 RepID=UPI004037F7F3
MTAASPWLPFGSAPDSRVRLLCLPHAGAGASAYRAWAKGLPADIGVCPVQLPGRESRMGERPFDRVEPLVEELAAVVAELVEPPYALFGHSLGALVAFELAVRLRGLGVPEPVHLFVSGRQAPRIVSPLPDLRDLDLADLAAELARLGGTPKQVLDNLDLLGCIAPMLRADFAVNETYRYTERPPLELPVTAFAATADPRADLAQITAWQEQTSAGFRVHRLPGDHFAVLRQAAFVHARIADALAPAPVTVH